MSRILKPEGLRGKAMVDVSCELLLHLGRAAAQALSRSCNHPPVFYISREPRRAAEALEAALCAGICAGGGMAHTLGVLPASAMALLLSEEEAEAGIAIAGDSAQFQNVCIQLFAKSGLPMSAEQLDSIETMMSANAVLPPHPGQECGIIVRPDNAALRYLQHTAKHLSGTNGPNNPLRIAVDCANGAASALAEPFFRQLHAEPLLLHHSPNGLNINVESGFRAQEELIQFMKAHDCAVGFALDGGGGRCLAFDETGELVDGDRMLAIFCQDTLDSKRENAPDPTAPHGVAVTLLTNLGFLRYAKAHGIVTQTTQSAAQFVLEMLRSHHLALGGDGTGYLYFHDLPAADGLMTAGRIVQVMQRTQKPLSTLAAVMEHDPQVSISLRIPQEWREIWKNDPEISSYIAQCSEELGMDGRLVVRERREDAIIRILLEGRDFRRINSYAFAIAEKIRFCTNAAPHTSG